MFTRKSMFALAALAAIAASVVASPALAGGHRLRNVTVGRVHHAKAVNSATGSNGLWHSFCVDHPHECWRRHGR